MFDWENDSAELEWTLKITKNNDIEFELFSLACSNGQYFTVFAQLRWLNTGFLNICLAVLGEYWKI